MLHDNIWIETCKMGEGSKGCCISPGSESCCGDIDTWFDFTPGKIQAVLNNDGIDRLTSTVPISASTITSLGSSVPQTSSRNNTGGGGDTVSGPGNHQMFSGPAIAVTVVLSVLLAASWAVLVFLWMKYGNWKKVLTGKVAGSHGEEHVMPQELPGN